MLADGAAAPTPQEQDLAAKLEACADQNTEDPIVPPATCAAGSYCPSAAEVLPCPAGSYCPENADTHTQCPANSYCPAGSSTPLACPTGKTSVVGVSAVTDCHAAASAQCEVGHYCKDGEQHQCAKGHFCPADAEEPTDCPVGTFADSEGKEACEACETGSVAPATEAETCTQCPVGHACPSATAEAEQCARGTY